MEHIHLHDAAASGNFRGGPYNARNETAPLHVASFNEELEVVRPLLEHSADIKTKDKHGDTALQDAANRGYGKVVKMLREHEQSRNTL
jgi:ankyrin repeat protein